MSANTQPKADLVEIKRALSVIPQPGDVVELRALEVEGKTHAGYFNDFDKLSKAAAGVYVVLNEVNPALLARAANRVRWDKDLKLTQDKDILKRRWLPIDADAERPAGISSTDEEHEAALDTVRNIRRYLITFGFPADSIILADSGNGAHLLCRINLPNDAESDTLIKNCLRAIMGLFQIDGIIIDQTVSTAARIWKLYGTLAGKGDSIPERPHRIARILEMPDPVVVVAHQHPPTRRRPTRAPENPLTWLPG